jgi:hypothetical protein
MKALLKHLDGVKGRAASETWLKTIRVQRDDLDDETRPMPLTTLHRALQAFAEVTSRDAIGEISAHLIAPDNLGMWMRILRGTVVPADAFARLDSSDSEYGRTTRWETIESRLGFWRGRVHIAHDPSLEEDGLLALMRVAELAAVPALFGYGTGTVSARGVTTSTVSDVAQEFEVRWSVPNAALTGRIGAFSGIAVGAIPILVHPSVASAALAAGCAFTRSSGASCSRRTARSPPREISKGRSSPASTAPAFAWARARAASSTRPSASTTASRSRSSCSAPPPPTTPSPPTASVAKQRRSASRGTRTSWR